MAIGIFIVAVSSGLAGIAAVVRPAAGAARGRRHRLGDVHRVGVRAVAHLGRSRTARTRGRLLPGRIPDRRHGRARGRRPAVRHRADRALLLLRRHPRRGRHGGTGAAAPAGGQAGPADAGRVRFARWSATRGTRRPASPTWPRAGPPSGCASSLVPVLVVEVLHRPTSWTGVGLRRRRGGPDHRRRSGRAVRRHGRPPARHDRRRAGRGGDHAGGAVRPQHLGADRGALRVRGGLGLPRHRAGCRRRRRDRRGAVGHGGRGLLDVRRPRGHRRPAGGGAAGRCGLLPGRVRRRRRP